MNVDVPSLRPPELDKVIVSNDARGRHVTCFCGAMISRSIVPHLKTEHETLWQQWVRIFIELRGHGWPLKRVMRLFKDGNDRLLFSWTVIERAIRTEVESGLADFRPAPVKISDWAPVSFKLETSTLWDFPQRGTWAHRAVGDSATSREGLPAPNSAPGTGR